MIAGLEDQLAAATSVGEAERILTHQLAGMDVSRLAEQLARAAFAARLAGETNQVLSDQV